MGGNRLRITFFFAAVLAAFSIGAASASAAATIESSPIEFTFLPGPYTQPMGEVAVYNNTSETAIHNVTSTRRGPDGRDLFASDTLLAGQSSKVFGTEYLGAGTYPFYCTLHTTAMSGELIIEPTGKAVRRPKVKVSFTKQKLAQIRKKGRLKIKVRAATLSRQVKVTATKGKVRLVSKGKLNFKAGQTRTLNLKLTAAGRKALKKGKVAKIKLKASVPWGKTATAVRKVR